MIKNFKIFFIFFFLICTNANASLLWKIQDGINEFQNKNFSSAKNFFLDYIVSNPNDEDGYWFLGEIYKNLSDKNNSIKYFKKSYQITSENRSIEKIIFENKNINIEDYFDMAAMYYETGKIKESSYYADMMLKIDPKSSSAYFIKAKIALLEGDKEQAGKYISKAIIFDNNLLNTNLAKELGITSIPDTTKEIYDLSALELYFKGEIDKTIENLKKSLEIEKNPETYAFLTECYLKNNDINSAKSTLEEYKKTYSSDNLRINLLEAKIYSIENNPEKEFSALQKAYKINPNNIKVLLYLGNYYLNKKDYKNAKIYFETLINVNDAYYEGYFGYIYSLIETGKLKEAINLIRKASSINPKSSEVQFLLSKICSKEANYKEALEYINEALKLGKHNEYYFEKAKIEYYLKNYSKSLEELNKITKLNAEAEKLYIKNYIKLNEIKKAEEFLNEKLSLDKNSIIYKYNLYILYKLQGDEKKSKAQFAQIKKFKPATPDEYIDLSEIYYELTGKEEPSIKILNDATKKYPNSYELYEQKMKIYYMADKPEKLKETIEQAQKLFN